MLSAIVLANAKFTRALDVGGACKDKLNMHFCHDTIRTILILTTSLRAADDLIQGAVSNRTSQQLTKRVKSHLICAAKQI